MQLALEQLKTRFGVSVLETSATLGNETAVIAKNQIVDVVRFLRDDPELQFNMMMDLAGVDYPERTERYEVVYHLYSLQTKKRIRLKVRCGGDHPTVPSIHALYKAADWFEREAYDMFGIYFEGHPNLKRILMFEEFEGHPLRKDYPINKRPKVPSPDSLC